MPQSYVPQFRAMVADQVRSRADGRRSRPTGTSVRPLSTAGCSPAAAYYIDLGDFVFYRLDVENVRYVGGYGR